ncbi:hypothetical protein [Rhodococcus sp. IEGM 1408]|uniref:hypothetical protein n=1 Tax=Rhodococcus sp. IEGM 1408 TaxID=3082220 RepID=UPI0029549DA9|nr:hypothetical protein [Rhodococcus sp. IEGM 1408]MDV8001690.1 hypothetical protein [Rhodococcus sp. IEGM 1408]
MNQNSYRRAAPSVVTFLVYLVALAVPVVLSLAIVGSSPFLLDKVVPEQHRDTVAAFSAGAARLSGQAGGLSLSTGDAGLTRNAPPGAPVPHQGQWSPRRFDDYSPPAGLVPGVDFAVEITDDVYIPHWPCEHDIPVWSFDAPPGSGTDLVWAVETLASASGLPLRYAGPGSRDNRESEGAISVNYGDHPMFDDPEIAGVGGPTIWPEGLIRHGSVTLRPDQINPVPGDPWTRALTMHELMHAVGIDHAVEHRPEIMAERPGSYPQLTLGYGDRFALHLVGCD